MTETDQSIAAYLRGVELGKRMYESERCPENPPWEEAEYRVRSVYIACAVKHARQSGDHG